jgi:hypothetical protein
MKVLDADLSESGDELLAKDWAAEFLKGETTAFLAYRSGERTVVVLELSSFDLIRKMKIKVNHA